MLVNNKKAQHEIEHGVLLASQDTEKSWGWGTPAGKIRAQRRAKLIIAASELNSGKKVLEIGCGTGLFTEIFAETGADIIAVDISPELLQKAKSRNLPPTVHILEKRFEDCDLDGPFDAILGSSILHHLAVKAALAKIYELLKPGGVISFAEPNFVNPQVFLERKFRKWFPYTSPDEIAFVRWHLKKDLEEAGMIKIKITPFDWLHPSTPVKFISPVNSLGQIFEKTPILKEFAGSLLIRAERPD
jgi:2-polyprenyl-3-methyl-5-hydroxy-6-metoxy-1,4-benzoquinol methylase